MFCSVSLGFANHGSQVSQIRVSQGFANTCFAVMRLFRKIRKVSQIQVFASFGKQNFSKVSQIRLLFRKVLQVWQGFHNLLMKTWRPDKALQNRKYRVILGTGLRVYDRSKRMFDAKMVLYHLRFPRKGSKVGCSVQH